MTTANTWFGSGATGALLGYAAVPHAVRVARDELVALMLEPLPTKHSHTVIDMKVEKGLFRSRYVMDTVRTIPCFEARRLEVLTRVQPLPNFISHLPRLKSVAKLGGIIGAAAGIFLAYHSSTEPPSFKELLWAATNGGISGALGGVAAVASGMLAGSVVGGGVVVGMMAATVASTLAGAWAGAKSSLLLDEVHDHFIA